MKLHFISGLPRAGSTLLSGLLSQNPNCHATITSPLHAVIGVMRQSLSPPSEHYPMMNDAERHRLYAGTFDSYYADVAQTGRTLVFDSNRSWTQSMALTRDMFPNSKVIACVRSVAWVMDSLERLFAANNSVVPGFFRNMSEAASFWSRSETLMRNDRLIGASYAALQEAYFGDQSNRLLLLDYSLLATRPQEAMAAIYDFIGEPPMTHDLERVALPDAERVERFDAALAVPGLHRLRPRVAHLPRRSVLPPELFQRLDSLSFWRDGAGTRARCLLGPGETVPSTRDTATRPRG